MPAAVPLLNIDAGEHDDEPEELYALADVVNIACGGHAGDAGSMERVLRACKTHGTSAGAHPSFEDREGFGRREPDLDAGEIEVAVRRQCEALRAVAGRLGVEVRYVKAHGALYHLANRDARVAAAVYQGALAALGASFTLIGPPDGELRKIASNKGTPFAREGFADRAMRADGTLVPRSETGAVISDPAVARAQTRSMIAGRAYDTLCVHGDTAGALDIARAVRQVLDGQ